MKFFLLKFILFVGGKVVWAEADMKRQGDKWDQSAWCEIQEQSEN